MSGSEFSLLLDLIAPFFKMDDEISRRSSGAPIPVAHRLALTLRVLSGGSYLDERIYQPASSSKCYMRQLVI